jgi:hypothetical protein
VQLLPGVNHASLILHPSAIAATVDVVRALQRRRVSMLVQLSGL